MRAKIDKNGFLYIEKKGAGFKPVWCPFVDFRCGDWCCLFEEPYYSYNQKEWVIDVCKKTLSFDEIIDEREGGLK